jgi:3-oxoacyl-[acyl-carrier-protein] synthase II
MKPLAVTGIGAISPLGATTAELLAGLDAGRSGIAEVELPAQRAAGCRAAGTRWVGRVTDFDASASLPPMRARRLDRGSRFAVAAAKAACRQAGLAGGPLAGETLGVILGTSSAGSGPLTAFLECLFRHSPEAAPPFEFPNTVANAPASYVSIELGLKGPSLTLAQSEAVLGTALVAGRLLLGDGRCRALLIGAVDEWNPVFQLGFAQLGALRGAAGGGGGMVLAEGAALLLLEAEELALARGARVLARVLGVAAGSVAGEPYLWLPDSPTLARVIREALDRSGMGAADVGSVVLAANGIEAMERAEAAALAEVFAGRRLAATGIKGAIGERAVAGALSLAVAVLSRARRLLPPYAGGALCRWPEPVQPLAAAAELPPGATLVLFAGFGGNYAAAVVG